MIAALMARSEEVSRDHSSAGAAIRELSESNRTLTVNLQQHAVVVEKLIGLNADLMDARNDASLAAERRRVDDKGA